MIEAAECLSILQSRGVGLFSGVPCSYLTPLINEVIDAPAAQYLNAVNEGDAVAVAVGAQLGGTRSLVMFQNSGFGNAVNPLTSLAFTFRVPILSVVTWRGEPGGEADEPQHELMGQITPGLFDLMRMPWCHVPDHAGAFATQLGELLEQMDASGMPGGLLLRKGIIRGESRPRTGPDLDADPVAPRPPAARTSPQRFEPEAVLRRVQDAADDRTVLIATTGFTGRALYAVEDRPNQFYMAGSMGCALSVGLGLAVARPDLRVVVIDGDGALLMRLGALAMAGSCRPPNLLHLVLDNAAHDSTGTQATLSATADLPAAAIACGYPQALRIDTLDQLDDQLNPTRNGLRCLHMRTLPRADRKLPRPHLTPPQVAERLQDWMGAHAR